MLITNCSFIRVSETFAVAAVAVFALLVFLPTIGMFLVEGTFLLFSNPFTQRALFVSLLLAAPYLVNHYYLPIKAYVCQRFNLSNSNSSQS